jgi:hypothetical protein
MFLSDISVLSNLLRSNLLGGGHCTGVSEGSFKKKLKQRVKASWHLLARRAVAAGRTQGFTLRSDISSNHDVYIGGGGHARCG